MKIERGDILMVNLGQVPGTSLQSGIRPVVVVSNNKANTYSPVVTVVPFTSRVYKKRYLPTHVFINRYEMVGLKRHGLNRSQALMFRVLSKNVVMSVLMQCGGLPERWRFRQEFMRRGIMTAEEYRKYLETDFDDVDVNELKDIRKVRIDRSQTKEKRIAQYLKQVGNPYMVRVGNVKVKIRFANNGVSFEDAFEDLLLSV